jgi:hypothetical protein
VGKLYWSKLYLFIRNNGGWDNFEMKPIFKGEGLDIKEKEQYFIDLHKPTLNSIRSIKELKIK